MEIYTDKDGIERPDRRRRNRLVEDYRIQGMFDGLDNLVLSAEENGDRYTVGYVGAMRHMLEGLARDCL